MACIDILPNGSNFMEILFKCDFEYEVLFIINLSYDYAYDILLSRQLTTSKCVLSIWVVGEPDLCVASGIFIKILSAAPIPSLLCTQYLPWTLIATHYVWVLPVETAPGPLFTKW